MWAGQSIESKYWVELKTCSSDPLIDTQLLIGCYLPPVSSTHLSPYDTDIFFRAGRLQNRKSNYQLSTLEVRCLQSPRPWRAEIPLRMLRDFNSTWDGLILPPPIPTCYCDMLLGAGFWRPERSQNLGFSKIQAHENFRLIHRIKEREMSAWHANRFYVKCV